MRKLIRSQEPDVLEEHSERLGQQWHDCRMKNPSASWNWYKVDKKSIRELILPILRKMNKTHCSFCDCYPMVRTSSESIEHFKPKSRKEFYKDAYKWENLYYSCDSCQTAKKELWDDKLLRPDKEEFSFEDFFVFDFNTGEIFPNPSASKENQKRARVTIDIFDLDSVDIRIERKKSARAFQMSHDNDVDNFAYRDFVE